MVLFLDDMYRWVRPNLAYQSLSPLSRMRLFFSTLQASCALALLALPSLSGCSAPAIEEARADSGPQKPARAHRAAEASEPAIEAYVPAPATRQLRIHEALAPQAPIKISRDSVHWRPKGSPCAGYYNEAPSLSLTLTERQTLRIGAAANNRLDMVMAIQREDGHWLCNDDGPGTTDPSLIATLDAGTHHIYFGSYARLRDLDYRIQMERAEVPQWESCEGAHVQRLLPGEAAEFEGQLSEAMHACQWLLDAPNCAWFLPSHPVACIDLPDAVNLDVQTRNADFDTTLVVQQLLLDEKGPRRGPARLFNDDMDATDAHSRIAVTTQPGRYAIFVGSYRFRTEGRFELQVRAETPDSP